jgi:glutamate dehydrogenase/leucine dehydrogenase
MIVDELGPEVVIRVHDSKVGLRGVLVVDNTVMGPAGGGIRMQPDLSEDEVADLARGMTYKFASFGFPRGGSKAGIVGAPDQDPERKRALLMAFGRAVSPYLASREVAIGPDMGVSIDDVKWIYEGAGTENIRSGLFALPLEGDAAAYHLTGYGVVVAIKAALEEMGSSLAGASIAVEGFGQVGAGTARYAAKSGARVVAVTTLAGGVFDPSGLDVARLLELRRMHGDTCVLKYGGEAIRPSDVYFLPVDVVVPGARPYVLNGFNAGRVQAKLICPAANIAVTEEAEQSFHRRGIVCLPDFVANAGGALASWVDILGGNPEQAFDALERLIAGTTRTILEEARAHRQPPGTTARTRARTLILSRSGRRRPTFEETRVEIRALLGLR